MRRRIKLDSILREAEIAMAAAAFGHGLLVCEMGREGSAEAAGRGDEVDDGPDALHVALFPGLDLRVEGMDELGLCLFALWEVGEDAEAVEDAAGVELDGAGVVPLLEFSDRVGAGEVAGVDVDAGVFVGGFAGGFEGLGEGGGVRRGAGFEEGGFDEFVFGVFGCDGSDEAEAEFELGVEEVEGGFLGDLVWVSLV